MSLIIGILLGLVTAQAPSPSPTATPDPWAPIRVMEGESEGEPGKGTVKRTYAFVLNKKFLNETNVSTYPPQPKNPKGEVHHHWSFFSYDRARKTQPPPVPPGGFRQSVRDPPEDAISALTIERK